MPRVPEDPAYAGRIGAYLCAVLPPTRTNFLDWWRDRLLPEIERNFAHLDDYDMDSAGLVDLAVLLEDAIDVHDRHWKIHWMLNFAQFSSTLALNATIEEVRGEADPALLGRLQSCVADRNWDSIEALWRLKEEVKGDAELRAPSRPRPPPTSAGARGQRAGRALPGAGLGPHQQFGRKSIWSHEFVFPTWFENQAPIIEAVRGYLATDYDYASTINAVKRDLEPAKELMDPVPEGEARERLQAALDLSLGMNPLTPDHHFYIDQGTNARLRLVLVAIGRKLVEAGAVDDPEDVMFLRYQELRALMADADALSARDLVSDAATPATRPSPSARASGSARPRRRRSTSPTRFWGFPEKFHREPPTTQGAAGLAASPGVVEGPARVVESLEDFDSVQDGDVLVCKMTNPAWVVLFTKISALVTDAGGVSHPAVVAREFAIPAVVGTRPPRRRSRRAIACASTAPRPVEILA